MKSSSSVACSGSVLLLAWAAAIYGGCSATPTSPATGDSNSATGGAPVVGAGGGPASTGGASSASGSPNQAATGGAPASAGFGGAALNGGAGASSGGASSGGASNGGASNGGSGGNFASAGSSSGGSSAAGAIGAGGGPPAGCTLPATVSFKNNVQPFLIPSCSGTGCHVIDNASTMAQGGYNHAYDWITATSHSSSCPTGAPKRFEVVIAVINAANPASCSKSRIMPPADSTSTHAPLTPCQIATLQAWLNEPMVTQLHRADDTSPTTPYPMPPFN